MKNANAPICPMILRQIGEQEFRIASEKDLREGIHLSSHKGLTKREHFAIKMLAALYAGRNGAEFISDKKEVLQNYCKFAVILADNLLEVLDEGGTNEK